MTGMSGLDVNKNESSGGGEVVAAGDAASIANYYAGRTIFITGVTGFLGKVLLWKLFKTCPDIGRIYVLMRGKRGTSPAARLKEMLHTVPFTLDLDKYGSLVPEPIPDDEGEYGPRRSTLTPFGHLYSKVIALDGNITAPDLGLSAVDKARVLNEVSIVFHVAASIKFEAPLKYNMTQNAEGTLHTLNLCEQMTRLDCLLHVSTAYANCHLNHIPEKIIPLPVSPVKLIEMVKDAKTEAELEKIRATYYDGRPNSYVFTKAVAEQLVADYEASVPSAIVRPSIVMPAMVEPIPGWLDSPIGPAGLATMAAVGLLRDFDWNYWARLDGVPVDIVINYMMSVPWHRSLAPGGGTKALEVYNAVNHREEARLTLGYVFNTFRAYSMRWPSQYMVRLPIHPPRRTAANPIALWFTMMFSHLMVAHLLDTFIRLAGHKPLVVRVITRMHKAFDVMAPFVKKTWTFDHDQFMVVDSKMSPDDRKQFALMLGGMPCSVEDYLANSYFGMRRFILREPDKTIPRARIQLRILQSVNWVATVCFWLAVAYLMHHFFAAKYFSMRSALIN